MRSSADMGIQMQSKGPQEGYLEYGRLLMSGYDFEPHAGLQMSCKSHVNARRRSRTAEAGPATNAASTSSSIATADSSFAIVA